jgi:phosphate transport system permease protein
MRIGPAPATLMALTFLMFITSTASLLIGLDLSVLAPAWEAALLISALILAGSFLSMPGRSTIRRESYLMFIADLVLILSAFAATFSGLLSPGYTLRPDGIGAAFGYDIIFPVAVLFFSLIILKDAINITYAYSQKGHEVLVFLLIRLSAVIALLILGGILFTIISKGLDIISLEFLTQPHRNLGQSSGISTAIEGTFWLIIGAMLVASPLGIGAAIYLNEYSRRVGLKRAITIAVSVLNGVPSIVYGLFGLAFLVSTFGVSLLSGSVILGLMNLPTIILTSQEALKSVPNSLREGSVALGATKWQTIRKVVLPSSIPGILTGLIIGVARAAGETAPIMWTAVTFSATPVAKVYGIFPDVSQPVNNLGYHLLNLIYFLGAWDVEARAWGTALVLLGLVLATNMLAIIIRNHYRKKVSW